jgi:alpha-tubulin suppressor-like RCC1 family protein
VREMRLREAHRSSGPASGPRRGVRLRAVVAAVLATALLTSAAVGGAAAEPASAPASAAAGALDAGAAHSCALVTASAVRCWGYGAIGQLGSVATATIGDDETPAAVAPVALGPGRSAKAVAAGAHHTCAVLDDGSVRCWGFGGDGRLGYAATASIGDDEPPAAAGPVDLGAGRTATAITAGTGHTCALLDDGSVRCWGYGEDGRLGYGDSASIGDDEPPAAAGPVNLGVGRTARAITAGSGHTCAVLDDGGVRCWGYAANGRLGYADTVRIGDDETPAAAGPVDLGPGRTATAITAGEAHTCAILDDGAVRCWGYGLYGALGYGYTTNVGDDEHPSAAEPVYLGAGVTAVAISAGELHTCIVQNDGRVRCWGFGGNGRLGYANVRNIGDNELPFAAGTVDVGAGRTATAISAGWFHTCARLDDRSVRCWGYASAGRLGRCSDVDIGDDETPGAVAPVNLEPPPVGCGAAMVGEAAGPSPADPAAGPATPASPAVPAAAPGATARDAERMRARGWRRCVASARRAGSAGARATAMRRCRRIWARTPGRVTKVRWQARSKTQIVLSFAAPGTHGTRAPAARRYLVRQSARPIRGRRDFRRAARLCGGSCRYAVTRVGARVRLTITDLRPGTTYHYAVAAYDNVSGRVGPRSATVAARTRSR